MLNLNLLPPRHRENIAFEMRARAVLAVGSGLILVALAAAALLLPTFFLLVFQKNELEREVKLERQQGQRAGVPEEAERIERLNSLARVVLNQETESLPVFPIFEAVFRDVPPALRLESARFRSAEKEVVIAGFAPTRLAMLEFLRALENNPRVAKISSPVTNIIKEADIKFSVTVIVK